MTRYTREFCEPQYNQGLNVPDKPAILARRREISARVRERIRGYLDVPYGPSEQERLDVYPAQNVKMDSRLRGNDESLGARLRGNDESPGARLRGNDESPGVRGRGNDEGPGARGRGNDRSSPVVVFIHGGYWQRYDKADVAFLAEPLTQAGYTLAAINYGLCPSVTLDEIVRQARQACAWTYRSIAGYGGDPQRILVCGNSAGGHLTAMMMATHWPEIASDLPADLVKGGLAISGIYELEPLRHTSLNDAIGLDADAAERLSPIRYTRATGAPLHIAVGAEESAEFHRQTRLLAELWRAPAHVVPGRHHFNLLLEFAEPESLLLKLLKSGA